MLSHASNFANTLARAEERAAPAPLRIIGEFIPEFGECKQHGSYPLNVQCDDGNVRWYPNGCQKCVRQERVRKIMQRADIDPRFEHCTFESYIAKTPAQEKALQACRQYADTFDVALKIGRSLILRGNIGTGKNHLAVAITRQIIAAGYTALHATAYEIILRVRDTWRKRGEQSETDVVRELSEVDLLVIDEIGRQYGSNGEQIHLFHIIDARYRLMRPTIVISNQPMDEIKAYLGDATLDRLREGGGEVITFSWESHRR